MSARRQIIAALSEDSHGGIATLQDVARAEQLVDAYRAEVLNEQESGDLETLGEAALMYRNLRDAIVATMPDPSEWDGDGDEGSILANYVIWLAKEHAAATAPTATPELTARQLWLLAEIRAKGGRWKSGTVRTAYRLGRFGSVARSRCSRDLQALHAAGHLRQIDEDGVRYYVLAEDGA